MADARTLAVIPNQALPSAQVLSSEAVLDELKMILTHAHLNEVLTSVTRLIEDRIAGIAIERERSQAILRLAFDEIRTSEGQLRQTVDAIPQTIVVLGADGSVVYANGTVLSYAGYSADDRPSCLQQE
jgi:PAS domain-containing protein